MTDAHEPDGDPFASTPRYPAPGRLEQPLRRTDDGPMGRWGTHHEESR